MSKRALQEVVIGAATVGPGEGHLERITRQVNSSCVCRAVVSIVEVISQDSRTSGFLDS